MSGPASLSVIVLSCNVLSCIFSAPRFWDIRLQKCRDLENRVRCPSRSFKMSPINTAHMTSYWRSIVTTALFRVVCEIRNVKKCRDLEIRLRDHSRWLKVVPFDRLCIFLSVFYSWDRFSFIYSFITARHYALARSLLSSGVHPSVRLQPSCIVSGRLKISSNLFLDPVPHHSSFFRPGAPIHNSRGTPSAEALNTRRCGKFAIVEWNLRLSRKRYEIGPLLLRNFKRKSQGGGTISVDSDDLEWPWKAGREGSFFQADLDYNARTVWPRKTKFISITQCSRIRILCFFFRFQKNMTFYVFLKWRIKKS